MGGLSLQEIFYNTPGAEVTGTELYKTALEKLDEYFTPKPSKVYERHLFRSIKQEADEKFEKFVVRLRHQAAKCKFNKIEDHLIDQIVENVRQMF
ncbi:hypothetical protein TKK_0008789 [Trichogramma kaykai]